MRTATGSAFCTTRNGESEVVTPQTVCVVVSSDVVQSTHVPFSRWSSASCDVFG
jgi:hypothetical protein